MFGTSLFFIKSISSKGEHMPAQCPVVPRNRERRLAFKGNIFGLLFFLYTNPAPCHRIQASAFEKDYLMRRLHPIERHTNSGRASAYNANITSITSDLQFSERQYA